MALHRIQVHSNILTFSLHSLTHTDTQTQTQTHTHTHTDTSTSTHTHKQTNTHKRKKKHKTHKTDIHTHLAPLQNIYVEVHKKCDCFFLLQ